MPTTDLNTPSWWGGEDRASGRPSILGLIDNGTLDLRTGALLWLLVDRKSSILAAAGPQLAGKTTLLTALLDLMPPAYRKILTLGRQEDFSFLKDAMPEETYLLVAELSDHTPAYLWGDAVKKLFDALDMGYSMLATMHADSPEEALALLRAHPVFIPDSQLHRVEVVVNLVLTYGEHELMRRVSGVTLIAPGPSLVQLVGWDPQQDSVSHSDDPASIGALAALVGMAVQDVESSLEKREDALRDRVAKGGLEPTAAVEMAGAFGRANA